ncbi:MATE family efflux transporter [Kineosporia babensis]|uniref:O-antigen/teichoic acid export membrane protein n=1 Tax=Kineosporia babensis TaxID=499548 RepID=A0A9X1NEM1_9ACTN|nr:hypothetical protein [Kineosporia babensis]MCD5312713.1 hypothetical protein [Kineosporia babensis]
MAAAVLGQAAFALLFVVMSRASSPAALGTATAFYGLALIVTDVVDFGTSPRTFRDAAAQKIDDAGIQAIFDGRNLIALVVGLAWILSSYWTPLNLWESTAVASFILLRVNEVATFGLIQANEQFADASWASVAERVATLAVGSLFIGVGVPVVPSFFWALAIGALTGLLLARRKCLRAVRLRCSITAFRTLKDYGKYGKVFAFSGLVTDFYMLDGLLISSVASSSQAGYFAVGSRLTGPFAVVATSLGSALTPRVAAAKDRRSLLKGLWIASGITLAVTAVALGIVFVTAPWMVIAVFGQEYEASIAVVQAYALAGIVVAVTYPLISYLQASGRATGVAWVLATGVTTHLALVTHGAAVGGASGAAKGYLIANCLVLVLLLILLRSKEKPSEPVKPMLAISATREVILASVEQTEDAKPSAT